MEATPLMQYKQHDNDQPVVAASPLDLPTEVFQAGLDRRKQNRASLMEWVRSSLVENVDYGSIQTKHGPGKPSLWKPGAEKICGMLGVSVHFPTLHDYEQAVLNGVSLQQIIIRCEIHAANGAVVAHGVGARNLKQDCGDINKALKMAEKSAHIDTTLRMAGLSEIFTQDLEDLPPAAAMLNGQQLKQLLARISHLKLNPDKIRIWLDRATGGAVDQFEKLNQQYYQLLNEKLDEWEKRISLVEKGK